MVGGGGAGCRAAIEAYDRGVDVVLALKGRLGHSGCTVNVGTTAAVGPWSREKDSTSLAMRDLLAHGGFLGNQDLAKVLVDESAERVLELERWGIDFERDDEGDIAPSWSPAHTYPRNFVFKPRPDSWHDYGFPPGFAMMDVLEEQVRTRDIRIIEHVTLIDLLKSDGMVVGAACLDYANNRLVVFRAKAVILATGTYSQVFAPSTVSVHETGDGQAAAYRAGAELIDMESTQFVATSVPFPAGTRFLNADGQQFLEKYGIADPRRVTKEELCYAIWTEIREGRGTDCEGILLDMTSAFRKDPSFIFLPLIEEYLQTNKRADDRSHSKILDPFKHPVESSPRAHTMIGGIRTNERCETNVPGLYAAGAVAGGVYGLARPEGYTSMITLVFGQRAGLFAADAARSQRAPALDEEAVYAIVEDASKLVDNAEGVPPDVVKNEVRTVLRKNAWVMKDQDGLAEGLEQIRHIGASYPILMASDGYGWAAALEVRNMLLVAELMLVGSIERKESRGAFFRADYPKTDNVHWLKNLVYRQVDGEPTLNTADVDLKSCGPKSLSDQTTHMGRWVD